MDPGIIWPIVLKKALEKCTDWAVEAIKAKLKGKPPTKNKTLVMEPMGDAVVIYRADCTEIVLFATLFSTIEDSIMSARLALKWPNAEPETADAETSPSALRLMSQPMDKQEEFVCPIHLDKGKGKLGFFYFRLTPRNADLVPKLSLRLKTGNGQVVRKALGVFPYTPSP